MLIEVTTERQEHITSMSVLAMIAARLEAE